MTTIHRKSFHCGSNLLKDKDGTRPKTRHRLAIGQLELFFWRDSKSPTSCLSKWKKKRGQRLKSHFYAREEFGRGGFGTCKTITTESKKGGPRLENNGKRRKFILEILLVEEYDQKMLYYEEHVIFGWSTETKEGNRESRRNPNKGALQEAINEKRSSR